MIGFLKNIKIWKPKVVNYKLEMFLLAGDTDPEIISFSILEHLPIQEDNFQQ